MYVCVVLRRRLILDNFTPFEILKSIDWNKCKYENIMVYFVLLYFGNFVKLMLLEISLYGILTNIKLPFVIKLRVPLPDSN